MKTPVLLSLLIVVLTQNLIALTPGLSQAASARPDTVPTAALAKICFDQKIGAQISRDLVFRDEEGQPVAIGDYLGRKPAILVLGYYGCPMLCTIVLNGMIESLQDLRPSIGNQFEVIVVSIDSRETPALATAKKRVYLKRYGRHGAAEGWHFLTGDTEPIKQLADQVGFRFAYDSPAKQFAHPSGFVILTPEGKVSRYFFGAQFAAKEVAAALAAAGANQTGAPVRQLFWLCFHYSPSTGKYSALVMNAVRFCGLATLTMLGALWFTSKRRGTTGNPKQEDNSG